MTAKLYKRIDTYYSEIYEQTSTFSNQIITLPESIQAGDLCMLELIGFNEAAYSSTDSSAAKTTSRYYFKYTNDNHFIQVNGQSNSSYSIITSESVQIHASTVWSWETDSEWLSMSVRQDTYAPDTIAWIIADVNMTGDVRTGHLTLYSGTSSACITVSQNRTIPYISYPLDLSQIENSPTNLALTDMTFVFNSVSTWSIEKVSDNSILLRREGQIEDTATAQINADDLSSNSIYKITLENEFGASVYYFKTGSSSSYYINLSDNNNTEVNSLLYDISSGGDSKTITMKTNGSWTISTDVDWISISATSGSKTTTGKNITVTISQNMSGVSRAASVVFKRGNNAGAVLYINQIASDYVTVMDQMTSKVYVSGDTIDHVSGMEDTVSLIIKAGSSWSVTSDSSWLSFSSKGVLTKEVSNQSATLKLYFAENSVGNTARVAQLTFASGSHSFILYVSQDAKLSIPTVTTSINSTNINNPSVILYQDIHFSWAPVENAVRYVVKLTKPNAEGIQYYYFNEEGMNEYNFTIPYSWLSVDGNTYYFRVNSIDQQGNEYSGSRYCYTVAYGEKATIDGSDTPVWNNASDYQASKSFMVVSTSSWNAVSNHSWIHVSPTNGNSGDMLSVSLDDNYGMMREGSITVYVNGNVTTLNIIQCASLEEFPTINTPDYSSNEATPTIISSDLSSLEVTWPVEPQVKSYTVNLYSFKNGSSWHKEISSGTINASNAGIYIFENIQLVSDQIYSIELIRWSSRGNAGTRKYFIPFNGTSSVGLGDNDPTYVELEGEGDHQRLTIPSSGTWIATADSDWIMVYREALKQSNLDENGRDPSYYNSYIGNSGSSLYISALSNNTGVPRYGNVTITCGGVSIMIPVSQDIAITTAKITSPSLGTYSNPVQVPYQSLNLRWSAAAGGTGYYHIRLREKEPNDRTYETILETVSSSNRSYSIPLRYLKQGYDYLLYLITETDGIAEQSEKYYFCVGYENSITISLVLNTDYAYAGGKVAVNVSANGGVGGYQYAYDLIKDGETIQSTMWNDIKSRTFALTELGNYQIKVYVQDSIGNSTYGITPTFTVISSQPEEVSYSTVGQGTSEWTDFIFYSNEPIETFPEALPSIGQETALPTTGGGEAATVNNDWDILLDDDTIAPTLQEQTENAFYFTVSTYEAAINKDVTFRVYANNADEICLIVNDEYYESYKLSDGYVRFNRAFSQSGEKRISFARKAYGEWYDRTPYQVLTVLSATGTLSTPIIDRIDDVIVGENAIVTWHPVENAQKYRFILSKDDEQIFICDTEDPTETGELTLTIPGNYLRSTGDYVLYLMAIAEEYAVSDNSITFSVIPSESAVTISYPVNSSLFNIGDIMHTQIITEKSNMYTKLIATDTNGNSTEWIPDGNGICYPVATVPGEYTLQAFASDSSDFSDAYESQVVQVMVEGPQLSVKDIYGNTYGAVFANNTFTAHIKVNCLGSIEAYVDSVLTTNITQSANDPYLYILQISGLSEGKHVIRAKVTFGDFISEHSVLEVYCVSEIPASQQIINYASTETIFEYYPGSSYTKKVAFKSPVTLLGTYETEYIYVKYGMKYGFVYKSDFSSWDNIQQMEDNSVVSQYTNYLDTTTISLDETAFRQWAAGIIQQYYKNYCQYGNGFGIMLQNEIKNVGVGNPHPVWNALALRFNVDDATSNRITSGEYDGIYRGYYFTSLYKYLYDQYGRKSSFTTVQYDNESIEDYNARKYSEYQILLADLLREKGEIGEHAFDNIPKTTVGCFSLQYDENTGEMRMIDDPNRPMGKLEDIADTEANKAWTNFMMDSLQLIVDAAIEYYNFGAEVSDGSQFKKKMEETAAQGVIKVLEVFSNEEYNRKIAILENNFIAAIKCEIANSKLQDYNRLIDCLENIYSSKDSRLLEAINDPLFIQAVNELIALAKNRRFIESEAYATEILGQWYNSNALLRAVPTQREIVKLCLEELAKQIVNAVGVAIKEGAKWIFDGDHIIATGICDILTDFFTALIKESIEGAAFENGYALEEGINIKIQSKMMKNVVGLLEKMNAKYEKQKHLSSGSTSQLEIMQVVISKMTRLYEITQKYGSKWSNDYWVEVRDLSVELIGDILSVSWTKLTSTEHKGAMYGKFASFIRDSLDTITTMKDDMLDTSESLAKAWVATINDASNEKQVSYEATHMYNAFSVSVKNLTLLHTELDCIIEYSQQTLVDAIKDPKSVPISQVISLLDQIRSQVEMDYVGCQHYVQLLNLCTKSVITPTFYRDLQQQIKNTVLWKQEITLDKARMQLNYINSFKDLIDSGWNKEFRKLKQ